MIQPLITSAGILTLSLSLLFSSGSRLAIPAPREGDDLHEYPGFTLSYNEGAEQAAWVAYELTASEVSSKNAERSNRFRTDPAIATGSATDADYRKSGYDRGHLAPAADMRFSEAAMEASFYYSNMSPQKPGFNRGIWSKLESCARMWAMENGAVLIVTGPVLDRSDLPTIGPSGVAVPEYFYKVILDYREPERKAIAFIIPNNGSEKSLDFFACTVDEAESVTGIDFFPSLPDLTEDLIESRLDIGAWPLGDN